MAFVNEKYPLRTVDSERGIILSSERGYSTGHHDYKIVWQDAAFEFNALETIETDRKTYAKIHWEIGSVKIPDNLQDKRAEVFKIIEEALAVRSHKGESENVDVTIKFHPRIKP